MILQNNVFPQNSYYNRGRAISVYEMLHPNTQARGLSGVVPACIGASFSSKRAEQALKTDIPKLKKLASKVFNSPADRFAEEVNNWIDSFYNLQAYARVWLRFALLPPKGCQEKVLSSLINELDKTKSELLNKMKQEAMKKGGRLVLDRTEPVEYVVKDGANLRHPAVERYIMVLNKPKVIAPVIPPRQTNEEIAETVTNNILKNLATSNINPIATPTKEVNIPLPVENKKESMSPILMVAAAVGAYLILK